MDIEARDIRNLAPSATPIIVSGIVDNQKVIVAGGIDTPLRLCHFMAQLAQESAQFTVTREFASGAAYEGRKDLGNTQPGDGKRYRGRGLIQTVGRANYKAATADIRKMEPAAPDFEADPEALEEFPWALLAGVSYWRQRNINALADDDDVVAVTKKISGGKDGLAKRTRYLAKAKSIWMREAQAPAGADDLLHLEIRREAIPALRPGARGEAVTKLQRALKEAGFSVSADGEFGDFTESAVIAFQSANGLAADGVVGSVTWDSLRASTDLIGALESASSGPPHPSGNDALERTAPASPPDDSSASEIFAGALESLPSGPPSPPDGTEERTPAAPPDIDPPDRGGPGAAPSFHFVLEGEGARGDQVVWGKEFDLVFNYGVLSEPGLALLKGGELAKLVQDNTHAVLGIDVAPIGLTLVSGGAGRVARFENGAMVGSPPRFRLRAPEKEDAERPPRGVSVIFTVAGAMIYNFFLAIELVDAFADGPRATPVLDLDLKDVAAVEVSLPRTARLYIISKGDTWLVHGNIDGIDLTGDYTTRVSPSKLNAAYGGGTLAKFTTIAGNAIWRNIDGKLDGDADDKDAALASMKATMAAGSELYELFSADPVFKDALDKIERLPDGSRISIYSDGTAFPWELLYPLPYVVDYPPENYQPERFWGRRFIIESLLVSSTADEKPPAKRRQPGNLRVSMGFNRDIDSEPPWNVAGRPLLPVRLQKDYFDRELGALGGYFDQYDAIFDTLRTPYVSSLIYYFCHGSANQLKFDRSTSVFTPMHIMGGSYPGWPVVFLNACDAADISPLSFFSFRTKFRAKKAAGLIAPSFPVPTLFAAVFARAFLSAYADGDAVGEILFRLRRELLEKNNPLGLWYSLQCPLDVKAPEG